MILGKSLDSSTYKAFGAAKESAINSCQNKLSSLISTEFVQVRDLVQGSVSYFDPNDLARAVDKVIIASKTNQDITAYRLINKLNTT